MKSPFRFALALALMLGIMGLIAVLIFRPDARGDMVISGLIGQLLAALIFVLHSIFRDQNPTTPENPAGETK